MVYIILMLVCSQGVQDSLLLNLHEQQQEYKNQIAINGLLTLGLTATSGIYWKKGNESYNNYQHSMTIADALHYWEQTQHNDRIRNVCAFGALIFAIRTIYYYVQLTDTYQAEQKTSLLKLDHQNNRVVSIGVRVNL